MRRRRPRLALALGSGSARGWAHIGVIRALGDAGIHPDIICGTSIGALVGAVHAAGELDRFERWLRGLSLTDVLSFMDVRLTGGMIKGDRLMSFFRSKFNDRPLEELSTPFGAVATALQSGAEVWLRDGSTIDAIRASIALPGLFAPAIRDGQLLVDGGLVNPVPVSLARAMGAELVIAVDLSTDLLGRHLHEADEAEAASQDAQATDETGEATLMDDWRRRLQAGLDALNLGGRDDGLELPSMLDVMASSINIMQVRISRSRMAGDPPDYFVAPRLAHLGLLDFHRAEEAIAEGERAAKAVLPSLQSLVDPGARKSDA
ncbi:MAG: patatin-like phospholipase RssA [Burkholderiaceae bacterium]|nr:patatin-like phospholipase RssA [Burkholderiaceae bacterium]